VREPHATAIAVGRKRSEHRSRRLALGPLLIVKGGRAVCTVDVVRIRERSDGTWSWVLANARRVRAVEVPRSYGWIRNVSDDLIRHVATRPAASAAKVSTRAPAPYRFQRDDRVIRGIAAYTPSEARRTAQRLANEVGDWTWIMRDGISISGSWPAAR
jgi:hypothetical protein